MPGKRFHLLRQIKAVGPQCPFQQRRHEGKKASFKEAGIAYTINQIDEYRACGIDGIHLYALNKYDDVARIVKESGIVDL